MIVAALAVATIVGSCEHPVTDLGSIIAQLVVSPQTVTLQQNQAEDFLAVGFTATGDSADIAVSWSATGGTIDSSSAGKRHYGHYTSASCGTFTVTATSHPGNVSQAASVTVTGCPLPVAAVTVTPPTATIGVGQTAQYAAITRDAFGNPLGGRTVTWSSSNPAVATVNGTGQATGVAVGAVTITATSEGKSGTAALTVTTVPVASVTVSPATASVPAGQTMQLAATPKDANGNSLSGRTISWSSGSTAVATVSASGLVTGVAAGSATITATSEGQSGTATITVSTVPVASVTVTPATASVQVGQTMQLTATPKDANGNSLSGRAITWSSGSTAVATVSASGVVSGVAAGSATITATSEGQSGGATITVSTVPVASVTVNPATTSVQVGQTVQFAATPKDASGNPLSGRSVSWASSNTAVATVSASGLVTGVTTGAATITATSEGKSGTAAITVSTVLVASVTVSPASASVQVGQTVQLTATPKDANGNLLAGRTVTWASSNTAVATVSASGLVTGGAAGSATITATSEGQSGSATITVSTVPVASVTVNPATASVQVGQTVQLTATPQDANGNSLPGRTITWSSGSTAVATVSASGLVTAVAAGAATITATSEGQSGSATITVSTVPVAAVTVSPATASVQVGQTVQLTATPKDANGNPLSGRTVTWASSNTAVATVSASGLVTGKTAGTATITATSEGKSGASAITVTPVPVASVTVTPASASIQTGQTAQLTATPKDVNGNPLTGRTVTWASSTPGIASVNATGLVTGVVVGTATITATSEGQSGTALITVTVPSSGGTPDPTLLLVATTSQVPLTGAYNALNVPAIAAGGWYLDPTTGVKIYKLTSGTFPTSSPNWGHDYSEGGDEVSLPYNGNTRAVLVRQNGGAWWLVDFTPGVGVGNGRQLAGRLAPCFDQSFSFSNNPATPYYAYVSNCSAIIRFDIRTLTEAPGNGWPISESNACWLQQSENDGLFTWLRGQSGPTVAAFEPATNTLKTYTNSGVNEPRIDRAGRYIGLSMNSPPEALFVWDFTTSSIIWQTSGDPGIPFSHNASLRRRWLVVDWNSSAPHQYAMFIPDVANSGQYIGGPANANDFYGNGNWIQHPADLNDQWAVFSTMEGLQSSGGGWLAPGGMVLITPNGQRRLLGHPYNTGTNYTFYSFVRFAPDGRYVLFTSDMDGSGRNDVFLAELPSR